MRRATLGVAAAFAAGAALSASAQGATTTYPSGGGSFDSGAEGWIASGESCGQLSGVALACSTTATYQPTGGNPGGALGTKNTVTLNVLALFQGSSVWTSPAFSIPADAQVTGASIGIDQVLVDGGLFGLSPSSTVKVTLVDLDTLATTDLVTTPVNPTSTAYQTTSVAVPNGKVVAGGSYELQIATTTASASTVGLLGDVTTLVDNVRLAVTTPDPPTGGPNPGPKGPGSPGGNGGDGGDGGSGNTGGTVQRGAYSNSEISSLMSSLSINAASGSGSGGSLVPLDKCTLVGTAGNDRLTGTSGNDVICGLGGNDVIIGGGGRDVIDGANGNDRLTGAGGGDLLLGLRGNDRGNGGAGNDGIGGGLGRDVLDGGAGKDRINGSAGNDRLGGGGDADRLSGAGGGDRLTGGKGRDRLAGGAGGDRFAARDRTRDVLLGGGGRDSAVADLARPGGKGVRGLRVADRVSGVERVR